ncbi:MAG: hypothetical protein ACI4W7_00130, partial [Candidatus Spyradenecus sp.]
MIPSKIRGFRSRVINALIDCLRAQRPVAGKGVFLQRTPTGTIISATATGGGDITINQSAEVLRPLTIRKFSVEQTTSSGTTTATKWGLYYPPDCLALLYQPEENTALKLTELWAEHADFAENAYLTGHANWLDITDYVNEFKTNGFTYYAIAFSIGPYTQPTLDIERTHPTNDSDITATDNGYIVPLASVTVENGEISISQFNYGPLIEQWAIEGHQLMKCPDGSNKTLRTSWSATEAGEELSAEYDYAYLGQAYTRLKVCKANGEQFLSTDRRHQTGWHDPASTLYIRPLSLTNFGA